MSFIVGNNNELYPLPPYRCIVPSFSCSWQRWALCFLSSFQALNMQCSSRLEQAEARAEKCHPALVMVKLAAAFRIVALHLLFRPQSAKLGDISLSLADTAEGDLPKGTCFLRAWQRRRVTTEWWMVLIIMLAAADRFNFRPPFIFQHGSWRDIFASSTANRFHVVVESVTLHIWFHLTGAMTKCPRNDANWFANFIWSYLVRTTWK